VLPPASKVIVPLLLTDPNTLLARLPWLKSVPLPTSTVPVPTMVPWLVIPRPDARRRVAPPDSSTSPVWLKLGEVTLSVPPLTRSVPLCVTLLAPPAVVMLPLPASNPPASTILAGDEVPVVARPTDPAVRMAVPEAISMPCTAVALTVPGPGAPEGEPILEPWPVPASRRRLPPTFRLMSVATTLVPVGPMSAPEVDTEPPCSSRSAPTVIVREVVPPDGPPMRALPPPALPPPRIWALPALTFTTCDGAMAAA
jgi:hypothetical protein